MGFFCLLFWFGLGKVLLIEIVFVLKGKSELKNVKELADLSLSTGFSDSKSR